MVSLLLHQSRKLLARSDYDNKANFSCTGLCSVLGLLPSRWHFWVKNPRPCACESSAATDAWKPQLFSNKWLQKNTAVTTKIHYQAAKAVRSTEDLLWYDHTQLAISSPLYAWYVHINKHLWTWCLPGGSVSAGLWNTQISTQVQALERCSQQLGCSKALSLGSLLLSVTPQEPQEPLCIPSLPVTFPTPNQLTGIFNPNAGENCFQKLI